MKLLKCPTCRTKYNSIKATYDKIYSIDNLLKKNIDFQHFVIIYVKKHEYKLSLIIFIIPAFFRMVEYFV